MLLQRKPKKNDSAVNGCVWAQHVCEDVRVECEKCCALSRIFCLFTGYFMRTESKRKRLSKRNPTSLFTCSFAHGHWFISHKNRKAFVCTLYRYIITDPLENVEPTREKNPSHSMALRSFQFYDFFRNFSSARAPQEHIFVPSPAKQETESGGFFFACKYSHCIDLYSFNTFSCITKRRSQQRPATMCIHDVNVKCGWRGRCRWWW